MYACSSLQAINYTVPDLKAVKPVINFSATRCLPSYLSRNTIWLRVLLSILILKGELTSNGILWEPLTKHIRGINGRENCG